MRLIPRLLLAGLPAALPLAACGFAPQTPLANPPPAVATPGTPIRLSASDALALLANNTAVGLTDAGVAYQVFFTNGGVARLREGALDDTGTWRVLPDGQVCSQLPHVGGGAEICYVLARYGEVILFGRPDGPALGSIRVVAGNPLRL
jgi:hypothetical protein